MKTVAKSFIFLVYSFLYLPIVVLVIYSFNHSQYSLLWHGFTLTWYRQLLTDSALIDSALHSLFLGISAATLATILGTLCALCLVRYRFSGKRLLYTTVFILILLPDLVLGISLLVLYHNFHFPLGFTSLLIAHITLCLPFVVVVLYGRLVTYHQSMFDAAVDLGATQFFIFRRILLPLLMPGLMAAWLLCFTLSLDDIMVSYFVSGPSFQILPLQIYSMVRLGVDPEINAITTIILGITIAMVLLSFVLLRKK